MSPVLRLSGITKRFGPLVANDAISFEIARGEVVALLGENGAGKTTLMNILFGHYVADEGTVEAFGKVLPPGDPHAALEAGIGMVHQHFTLADNMTVEENIALGTQKLFSWKLDKGAARERIAKMASEFGLTVDPRALVASPRYLAQGVPRTPEDLAAHRRLSYGAEAGDEIWDLARGPARRSLRARGGFSANNGDLLARLAVNGEGIALLPRFIVEDDLRAGRLVEVLPDWSAPTIHLTLYYPPYAHLPLRVATFSDFFEAHVAEGMA